MKDPFVREVRKHRMEHTKQFNSDLHLICEDLRRLECSLGDRVVTVKARATESPEEPGRPIRAPEELLGDDTGTD